MMRVFKKTLALILSVMFVLPYGWMTPVASYADAGTITVSAGELVAGNYQGFTDAEAALLKSGLLIGDRYEYAVLADDGGLVFADAAKKTVNAVERIVNETPWAPVSARIEYDGGTEDISLSDGKGSYAYDGKTFTVRADYAASIGVPSEDQARLINGPYYLARAASAAARIDDQESKFFSFGNNLGSLAALTDGSLGSALSSSETSQAIADLLDEKSGNEDFLTVDLLLLDYEDSSSSSSFIFSRGGELKDAFLSFMEKASAIHDDPEVTALIATASGASARRMRTAMNALNAICDELGDITGDDFAVLDSDKNPIRSGLTDTEYALLDGLAEAAEGSEYHDFTVLPALLTDTVEASLSVALCDISVTLNARYIPADQTDNSEAVALASHEGTVRVEAGISYEEAISAVLASDVAAGAFAAWRAVDTVNYDMTVSGIGATVDADAVCVISFAPKACAMTYDFETALPASVPYGYNLTLPVHEGAELVYDYDAGGTAYLQGEVLRVTGDTRISRTEDIPWEVNSAEGIIAEAHKDILTDAEYGVLASGSLSGEVVRLRRPGEKDVMVVPLPGGRFRITAPAYESGIPGLVWTVSSCSVLLDGETLVTPDLSSGTATVSALSIDTVRVEYTMEYTGVSDDAVLSALDLPGVLAGETAYQKNEIAKLVDLYDRFGELDRVNFNRIKVAIRGSEMSDETKAAAEDLIATCFDDDSGRLYLCAYIERYVEGGLAYYYENGAFEEIISQVESFKRPLSLIYNDPEFYDLLVENEYEEKYEYIGDIVDSIGQIDLTAPNKAINVYSGNVKALVDALESIDPARTFDGGDVKPLVLVDEITLDESGFRLDYAIKNYEFSVEHSGGLNLMRFAPGVLTTSAQIRASEGLLTVDLPLIAANTDEGGTFRYIMPDGGVYSVWLRFDDGREIVLPGLDFTEMEPSVTFKGGLNVTLNNLYGVKEYFIARGTQNTINDCKRPPHNIVRIQATDDFEQAQNSVARFYSKDHSYNYLIDTFNVSKDETYTIAINYFDGRPTEFIHFSIILPKTEISKLGLRATISGDLEGVRVVRVAEGAYDNYRDVKRAPGVRNIALYYKYHDGDDYTVQFRRNGLYTMSIEYRGGYNKVVQVEIKQLVPTFRREGNTFIFGNLDHLFVIKYSAGTQTTTGAMKLAGTKAFKPALKDANGEIAITIETPGTYTFCVQYAEESLNFYHVTAD